jgi:hypothetical protein
MDLETYKAAANKQKHTILCQRLSRGKILPAYTEQTTWSSTSRTIATGRTSLIAYRSTCRNELGAIWLITIRVAAAPNFPMRGLDSNTEHLTHISPCSNPVTRFRFRYTVQVKRQQLIISTSCINRCFIVNNSEEAGVAQRYSAGLRAEWSGVRVPAGDWEFSLHHRVQTGSEAHPASYPMGTRGFLLGGKATGAWD